MKHKGLIMGFLVILLVAGGVAVSASVFDAVGATSQYVQRFALAVPGWDQVNSSGFGDPETSEVSALETFNGYIYAGTFNPINPAPGQLYDGAQIFRSPDGVNWNAVIDPGFGNTHDIAPPAILDFVVFSNRLYASTGRGNASQIWRTANGTIWAPMDVTGFSDPDNVDVTALAVYNGRIYAGVTNQVTGAHIWRSFTGDNNSWTQMGGPGIADSNITGFAEFDGGLYAAVESNGPAQLWLSYGGDWTAVMSDGFGNSNTASTGGMAVFGGYLYVGAGNTTAGAQLWRTNDGASWEQAINPAYGDANNQKVDTVFVFQNQLYVSVKNTVTGMELWRLSDGSLWEQANLDGFGDSNNSNSNESNATARFLNQLYVGTSNVVDGGELWQMQLPAVHTDLSIGKLRLGSGAVVAGERITYTVTISNAGPTAPVTATVVDTWSPVNAVVAVEAPGCAVDLGGVITCTQANLGIGSATVPAPHIVFTTSATFSGTLTNSAHVSPIGDVVDINPDNDVAGPVAVTVVSHEPPPTATTDLSISKNRQGLGVVAGGERITFTLIVTNAGPASPVSAMLVDTWTPVSAVVGVDAPGCAVDLRGGTITCTHSDLGIGSVQLPASHIILTASAAFSGPLTNTASITPTGGVTDIAPGNNVSAPVAVTIRNGNRTVIHLPLIVK